MSVALRQPIGWYSLLTASFLHIIRTAFSNLIGLGCILTTPLLHPNSTLATAQADHTRKFAETLQVSWSLLTASFLLFYRQEECCRIVISALFRSDALVYGLMWGSKEAHMTRVELKPLIAIASLSTKFHLAL